MAELHRLHGPDAPAHAGQARERGRRRLSGQAHRPAPRVRREGRVHAPARRVRHLGLPRHDDLGVRGVCRAAHGSRGARGRDRVRRVRRALQRRGPDGVPTPAGEGRQSGRRGAHEDARPGFGRLHRALPPGNPRPVAEAAQRRIARGAGGGDPAHEHGRADRPGRRGRAVPRAVVEPDPGAVRERRRHARPYRHQRREVPQHRRGRVARRRPARLHGARILEGDRGRGEDRVRGAVPARVPFGRTVPALRPVP